MSKLGRKIKKCTVAGEDVFIKQLNGGKNAADIIDLLQQVGGKPSLIAEIGALLVVTCLCDADGVLLYSDKDVVREEATISFLTEFVEAALSVSGLGDDAKEVKKNLQAVQ